MTLNLKQITIVVDDYDSAIDYYCKKLGFHLLEDTEQPEQNKRWVVVAPDPDGTQIILARASNSEQQSRIGNQTGGRVGFFLYTTDFWTDFERFQRQGVIFVREPVEQPYGTVAVFEDKFGNLWDLLQSKS